jgi:hypothetical protein
LLTDNFVFYLTYTWWKYYVEEIQYHSYFSDQNSAKSSTTKQKKWIYSKFHTHGTTNSRKSKKKKKTISILELRQGRYIGKLDKTFKKKWSTKTVLANWDK